MAGKRHSNKRSLSRSSSQRRGALSHVEKLRFITQYKTPNDPTSKRAVDREYRALKKFPLYLQRSADAEQRHILKQRGFFVTGKGVIIDGPRDIHRNPIKGARWHISKEGVVTTAVKQRRDIIYGMTRKEKEEFAHDPQAFINNLLERLRAAHPSIPKKKRPQIRLQWGAYQATKDFSPQLFWLSQSPLGKKSRETKDYTKKREAATDRLTGIHIVYHITKRRKRK
jgi:hypothetical protein